MTKEQKTTLKNIPDLAKSIAKNLKGGEVFALTGPLGAGKTTFVKTVAKELKLRKKITSPTFVIMNVFPVRIKNKNNFLFLHLDLYRTKSFREIKSLGLTELWGQKNTVTFIEWADKIKRHWPKNINVIKFEYV